MWSVGNKAYLGIRRDMDTVFRGGDSRAFPVHETALRLAITGGSISEEQKDICTQLLKEYAETICPNDEMLQGRQRLIVEAVLNSKGTDEGCTSRELSLCMKKLQEQIGGLQSFVAEEQSGVNRNKLSRALAAIVVSCYTCAEYGGIYLDGAIQRQISAIWEESVTQRGDKYRDIYDLRISFAQLVNRLVDLQDGTMFARMNIEDKTMLVRLLDDAQTSLRMKAISQEEYNCIASQICDMLVEV